MQLSVISRECTDTIASTSIRAGAEKKEETNGRQ